MLVPLYVGFFLEPFSPTKGPLLESLKVGVFSLKAGSQKSQELSSLKLLPNPVLIHPGKGAFFPPIILSTNKGSTMQRDLMFQPLKIWLLTSQVYCP